MVRLRDWLDQHFYPEYADNWDDAMFRARIQREITPSSRCLDFGAGRGRLKHMDFRGEVAFVAGVDVDPAVLDNPLVDRACVIDQSQGQIPFADDNFDIVYANNVMEHVADPLSVLREIRRVMRPGGVFLAKTPNAWHYVATIARLTPAWFHKAYNRLRGRPEDDTFPTLYRCNSKRRILRLAAATGFRVAEVETWEGRPEYLRVFGPAYFAGFLYERAVNSTAWLAPFRCVLYFKLRKPA